MKSKAILAVLACVLGAAVYGGTVLATPGSGFTATTLATAQFGELDLRTHTVPADWMTLLKTKGRSDLYVQSNVWTPGGTTGWHTHPGPSLIIVTAGTITAYDGDDPSCTPHVYPQGSGFVDEGGGHVHVLRNEGTVDARTIAVQLVPAGAVRRIDAAAPRTDCTF